MAVIGAGVIGAGWVACFLSRGLSVRVFDPSAAAPQRVRAWVDQAWPRLQELGWLQGGATRDALTFHDDLASALEGADFVQENTPERLDQKIALFASIDQQLPRGVLIASSTSSLPITALQEQCTSPERCVLGHPFNPVHLMPLVEVGGGEGTSEESIETALGFYESLGKQCVRLRREVFGHVANRLTSALFREAVSLVEGGYASVEDIDRAIRWGPAMKWAIQGQFGTFDINGGEGGIEAFLRHFAPGIVARWSQMTIPDLQEPGLQCRIVQQVEQARGGQSLQALAARQDDLLLRLLSQLSAENRT